MKKLKKIGILVLWITVASGMVFLLGFVNAAEQSQKGRSISVNILDPEENQFLDEKDILDFLEQRNDILVGEAFSKININEIEKALNTHPAIEKANVSIDVNGDVKIDVDQRKPLVRIFTTTGESYYIDNTAKLMPLSPNYTARVLVANGNITDNYAVYHGIEIKGIESDSLLTAKASIDDIYKTAVAIESDTLLSSLIHQISVNEQKEIVLYPAIGGHSIILGSTEDLGEKLKKLLVFYKEGIGNIDCWNKYSVINLKYKNQVVCVKK